MSDVNIQDQNGNERKPLFEMNEKVMTNRGMGVVKDVEYKEEENECINSNSVVETLVLFRYSLIHIRNGSVHV